MSNETRNISEICSDLVVKGEYEAAETIERIANSNDELGDNNILLNRAVDELLEALELADAMLCGAIMDKSAIGRQINAALAKAKGETE